MVRKFDLVGKLEINAGLVIIAKNTFVYEIT